MQFDWRKNRQKCCGNFINSRQIQIIRDYYFTGQGSVFLCIGFYESQRENSTDKRGIFYV
ncbi:hypothetical protein FHU10_2816 [Serratia fonticola]|uniref:Uncharacterized protein n=1 Tax=Serratia fonticola TaxID=47917 RepID=A0A559T6M0_SERFO|nr:hypothetical protein FHU09_4893 [Serratia fonticola]TQI95760.1 hypothetical protein FHU11_1156 [Serratia fonticola]TVZ70255.1 hypothetical protein FHU10_2816 [Serratia fonticola]